VRPRSGDSKYRSRYDEARSLSQTLLNSPAARSAFFHPTCGGAGGWLVAVSGCLKVPRLQPTRQVITDPEELAELRFKKRKEYEDGIRKNRGLIGNWISYATWEEQQEDYARARSVYERALDVDHRTVTLWLRYAEMEMKQKQVDIRRRRLLRRIPCQGVPARSPPPPVRACVLFVESR
jgi:hypothetical protein